jgi:DNA-directed RNA polymerase sigma subunit (sigma70/sigma32)
MGDPFDFISEDGWPYRDDGDDAEQLEPIDLRSDPDEDLVALHALPHHALSRLTDTERVIVRARFGLDGHAPRTLQELHDELGLSRERVRHALADGLDKLRGALEVGPPTL